MPLSSLVVEPDSKKTKNPKCNISANNGLDNGLQSHWLWRWMDLTSDQAGSAAVLAHLALKACNGF